MKDESEELRVIRQQLARVLDENEDIKKQLRYVTDRQAIIDCIYRYSRGVDRHDEEIIASVYHSDGIDDHGTFVGHIPEFVQWVNSIHETRYETHTHHITNHNCEIDGDVANTESYVMYVVKPKEGGTINFGSARYVDRLERRGGEWKIVVRRVVHDWRFQSNSAIDRKTWTTDSNKFVVGRWDREDLSYMRPVALSQYGRDELARKEKKAKT